VSIFACSCLFRGINVSRSTNFWGNDTWQTEPEYYFFAKRIICPKYNATSGCCIIWQSSLHYRSICLSYASPPRLEFLDDHCSGGKCTQNTHREHRRSDGLTCARLESVPRCEEKRQKYDVWKQKQSKMDKRMKTRTISNFFCWNWQVKNVVNQQQHHQRSTHDCGVFSWLWPNLWWIRRCNW